MENIHIEGTEMSPAVDFDYQSNVLDLRGICYLENVSGFFKPIFESLKPYLQSLNGGQVTFSFQMTYFNSSSARLILRILDLLDAAAERGNEVKIIWFYDQDDDSMEEQGEELGEDLKHAAFELRQTTS